MFICVDYARHWHSRNSNGNQDGALLYATEMEGGSSDEKQYPHDREVGCSVCSVADVGGIFTRWGSKLCGPDTTKLYEGFMANGHYGHRGSGANFICMHPQPQYPPGH